MTNKKETLPNDVINTIEAKFKDFTQWSLNTVKKLWNCGLSQSEWKVYSFLSIIDPFGDRWVELPHTNVISNYLNISQSSFYRAIAKLSENGIICFEDKGLRFKNNIIPKTEGHSSNLGNNPQNWETILKTEEQSSNLGNNPQNWENQRLKPLQGKTSNSPQTIQTIQTNHTFSEPETQEKERDCIDSFVNTNTNGQGDRLKQESSEDTNQDTQVISQDHRTNVLVQIQATPQDTFSAGCGTSGNNRSNRGLMSVGKVLNPQSSNTAVKSSRVQLKAWEWLPDGDWKIDGKLDPVFHEWLAKKWMETYKKNDFFQAKADVLAYFQKTPERLDIRWQQYQEELNARQQHQAQVAFCNETIISDGQRTIKSKDYTGASKQEPEVPVNPQAREMIGKWLEFMTGKKREQQQDTSNNNQYQWLHNQKLQLDN